MTTERPKLTNPEVERAENFLSEIYGITSTWLRMHRNAQVIKEFGPEKIRSWERQGTFPSGSVNLPLDLVRGIVLQDERNTYGLALGRKKHSRYSGADNPTLEFGFSPGFDWSSPGFGVDTDVDKLRSLVGSALFRNKRGEFYYDTSTHRLEVDCWIDDSQYGGRDINRWQKSAISPRGESDVVDTIKRLVRNFDPV